MKNVAIIGVVGVPANYGGFETLVENIIGDNASEEVKYTVFCSSKAYTKKQRIYKGASLKYIGLNANGVQSTIYDIASMLCVRNKYDVTLILGVSGCIFLPIFRLFNKNKVIVNIDGLEHQRNKWGKFAKWFLRKSEAMAINYADVIVADNQGIKDYVIETYHKNSELIAYGGDHVLRVIRDDKQLSILSDYGVRRNEYAISVCRIEPENNCHVILEAFSKSEMKLVYIGNWDRSEYGKSLKSKYSKYSNLIIHDPEYSLDVLYALRANAKVYVHGHSAGGTNPSLVEAMFFTKPIFAFDVKYNRATTNNKAYYFKTTEDLISLISKQDINGKEMLLLAEKQYTWRKIAKQYELLY